MGSVIAVSRFLVSYAKENTLPTVSVTELNRALLSYANEMLFPLESAIALIRPFVPNCILILCGPVRVKLLSAFL